MTCLFWLYSLWIVKGNNAARSTIFSCTRNLELTALVYYLNTRKTLCMHF
ncbi:unnamed protein product [Staurois parvus]|uniref:Uncharacterized protein n=1 Tax=Staurois parvus TaxID=386267 RepID=A0ABN9E6A3_9NEOB|nr:unnamed protein product [Staurois parvus]